jgi:histone H3/H4
MRKRLRKKIRKIDYRFSVDELRSLPIRDILRKAAKLRFERDIAEAIKGVT